MASITEFRPVVTVAWANAASRTRLLPDGREEISDLGAHWGIGFYSPSKVLPEEVVEIEGIPFTFAQGDISMRLNGATLDFANGKFIVHESAI